MRTLSDILAAAILRGLSAVVAGLEAWRAELAAELAARPVVARPVVARPVVARPVVAGRPCPVPPPPVPNRFPPVPPVGFSVFVPRT